MCVCVRNYLTWFLRVRKPIEFDRTISEIRLLNNNDSHIYIYIFIFPFTHNFTPNTEIIICLKMYIYVYIYKRRYLLFFFLSGNGQSIIVSNKILISNKCIIQNITWRLSCKVLINSSIAKAYATNILSAM